MLRVRFRLNSLEEVERWVLGFGAHGTAVRPLALAERLALTAKRMAGRGVED